MKRKYHKKIIHSFLGLVLSLFLLGSYALPAYAQTADSNGSSNKIMIPSWVKNTAGWWAENEVGDNDFIKGIQYMVNNGIMQIPPNQEESKTPNQGIPSWVKNNAGWWAKGEISDDEFVKGIQYLVSSGIISTNTTQSVQEQPQPQSNETQTYVSKDQNFSMSYPSGWVVDDNPGDNSYSIVTISDPSGISFISIGLKSGVLKLYSLPDYVHNTFDQVQNNANSTYIGEGKTTVDGRDAYFLMYMVTEDNNSKAYIKQVFVNANGEDVYFIALVTNTASSDVLNQFNNLLPTFNINSV